MAVLFVNEGGEVNDPADSGGHTNLGVTEATLREYCRRHNPTFPRSVSELTHEQAVVIYHAMFWTEIQGDRLPAPLAICLFDHAVHVSPARARGHLQAALRVTVDRVFGPRTRAAARRAGDEGLIAFNERRLAWYEGLARRRPKDKKFLEGWRRRVFRTEIAAIRFEGAA